MIQARSLCALLSLCALSGAALAADAVTELTVRSGGQVMAITALRPDILRVRIGRGRLPEDASWAVVDETRRSRVAMQRGQAGGRVTLRTASLDVQLDRRTLRLTVRDAGGNTLLDDADGAALTWQGAGFRLRKRLPPDAHYFGLGDKAGPLDRREQSYTLWNTDAYGFQDYQDPLYKSIPFVLAADERGRAFGLLLDNTWRSHFDFGRTEQDVLALSSVGGPVDYYLIAGPAPKDVVRAYGWLTGLAPLPPRWALGFQQSRYSYGTEAEVRAIADRLRSERIPADALYLDIDYQDRNRPFSVDARAFPDLGRLLGDLRRQQFHVVMITDLHIAAAPGQGYAPYDSGQALGAFLRKPDGSTFIGKVWPGASVFPDFSRAPVRDWWGGLYRGFLQQGAAGFWNDMNEPALFETPSKTLPPDTVHRIESAGFQTRDATHAEMHNVFGMLNSQATYEGLLRLQPEQRPFVLTRASYAGGQRYAATWTGDNSSSWSHLNLAVAQQLNLGLSGFAYVGDDIGGFTGAAPSPELLTRWIEIGAFNPVFRDHADKGKPAQEPWVGGEAQLAIRRRYIEARYRLLPYLYGLAEENSRTGLPIMRPVFLEFPQVLDPADPKHQGVGTQFMLGPDLLVAPAPVGESPAPYVVNLPGAGWFDYWTGEQYAQAAVNEVPRLERLPVFVRPGAIVPHQPLVQSTDEVPQGPLQIDVYPGADCSGSLYWDDGISFRFRGGEFLRQSLTCARNAGGIDLQFGARSGRFQPWWSEIEVVVHGWNEASGAAQVGGRLVPGRVEAATHTLRVRVPDQGDAALIHMVQ